MLLKTSRNNLVRTFILGACLVVHGAAALSQEGEPEAAALDELVAMLAEQEATYSVRIQSLSESLADPEAVRSITDQLVEQLRQLRFAISADSPILMELESQLEALIELEESLEEDQSRLSDAQTRAIGELLEDQVADVRQSMDQIARLQEQIDQDIVELESIQLFMTYQLRLSAYSGAEESARTIAEVLESSINQLAELSQSIEAIQPALTSD